SLGRRLLLHITDGMHTGEDLPKVDASASLSEALMEMSRKRLAMTAVVDDQFKVGAFMRRTSPARHPGGPARPAARRTARARHHGRRRRG
ncbi:hypothetical protein CEJ63_22450, partial [Acinetobacter baumannii]